MVNSSDDKLQEDRAKRDALDPLRLLAAIANSANELAAAGSGLAPLRNRMAALQFEPALPATPSPPLHADDAFPLQKTVQADRTAVIISTRGRPDIVNALVKQLGEQTRPPDHIFVIASAPEDIVGVNKKEDNLTVCVGRTGSSLQRNDGLALAGSRFSYIVFFDDDFVPSRFWLERMLDVFQSNPDVAGLTGLVLADGTTTAGISLYDARFAVRMRDYNPFRSGVLHDAVGYGGNMGCNMAFRYSAMQGVTFDEHLPLYAWLEDADFRGQVEQHGHVVRAEAMWGVHLGHKKGRGSGLTLGYSQIANAVYLAKKGTVPKSHLVKLAGRNLMANAARSFRPEPFVDRRGRLRGNMIALLDLIRGRIAPERVLEL